MLPSREERGDVKEEWDVEHHQAGFTAGIEATLEGTTVVEEQEKQICKFVLLMGA